MDLLKLSLERLFGFIAGVIPGTVVLTLFGLHHPRFAAAVRDIDYLGYRTKLSLVLAVALIAGWTVTTFFYGLMGFFEGVLRPVIAKWLQSGKVTDNPPWRNKNWRALAATYLGGAAPEDLDLVSDAVFDIQIESANLILDPTEKFHAIAKFKNAKGKAELADAYWSTWWDTLHNDVLLHRDPTAEMTLTIEGNLQAASLVLLCALPSTPILYHWWLICACLFWLSMRGLRTFSLLYQTRDPWSSFTKQINYLRAQMPNAKAKSQAGDSR
jgi:hypothetical protein